MSKQLPRHTPPQNRGPLSSLDGFQNSPDPKKACRIQEDDSQLEICERRSSAVAAELRLTDLYASGFEDSQIQSQEWLEEIQNSPTLVMHDGIKTEVQEDNSEQHVDPDSLEDQMLCDIEVPTGVGKDNVEPEAETAGATEGLEDITGLISKIHRMESTIAHLELLNRSFASVPNAVVNQKAAAYCDPIRHTSDTSQKSIASLMLPSLRTYISHSQPAVMTQTTAFLHTNLGNRPVYNATGGEGRMGTIPEIEMLDDEGDLVDMNEDFLEPSSASDSSMGNIQHELDDTQADPGSLNNIEQEERNTTILPPTNSAPPTDIRDHDVPNPDDPPPEQFTPNFVP
ncbi:hypothetical protein PQX77_018654 [Marasmius sp. AFHP31]|nr:hypothetical protein PQX77_018654 [Marasmius sp. AFHP31]